MNFHLWNNLTRKGRRHVIQATYMKEVTVSVILEQGLPRRGVIISHSQRRTLMTNAIIITNAQLDTDNPQFIQFLAVNKNPPLNSEIHINFPFFLSLSLFFKIICKSKTEKVRSVWSARVKPTKRTLIVKRFRCAGLAVHAGCAGLQF